MSTQWSAPDEHGTSTAAVTREDGVQTQWSRDKHGWTTPVSGADSEQQLTDAGYGDDRRQRYIDESGQDPEYAACVWDEQIIPAAVAAGEIPEQPYPFSAAELARHAASSTAVTEFSQQHPEHDPFDNDPASQQAFQQFVNARKEEIMREIGPALADRIEQAGGSWTQSTVAEVYTAHADRDEEIDL